MPRVLTNITLTSWLIALGGCGGQKGDTNATLPETADKRQPRFVSEPEAKGVEATTAQVVFAWNETTDVSLVVRPAKNLSLTHTDISNAEDKYPEEAKAFETKRVTLKELKPNTEYQVFITGQDKSGNTLAEPFVVSFQTTAPVTTEPLKGEPPAAKEGMSWEFYPENLPAGCTLELNDHPSWMSLGEDGRFAKGLPRSEGQTSQSFTLSRIGRSCSGESTFTVRVSGDPLYPYAWHINPHATGSFSWLATPPAIDAHLDKPIAEGFTGRGLHVAVVDSGMQRLHPDLVANVLKDKTINLEPLNLSPCTVCDEKETTPPLGAGEAFDQGTAVAGIIGAEGWNGEGSRGVAPNVKLSAYNLTARRFQPREDDYLRALTINADIVAFSGSPKETILTEAMQFNYDSYDIAQKKRTQLGREEKGIIYISAAGDLGTDANAALNQRNTTPWTTVVGAYNTLGQKATEANTGSNLWISAPGGDNGYQSDLAMFEEKMSPSLFYQSVIAPDIFNEEFPCTVGYAKSSSYFTESFDFAPQLFTLGRSSGFNLGWNDLNENCAYTASMAPTPAATGVVAGLVAILLEVDPDLTWRDIKYILAKTAQPIDAGREAVLTTIGSSLFEKTLPWTKNAAGFLFHNWYGFGAIDAEQALALAKAGPQRQGPLYDTNWILANTSSSTIPPASISGTFSDFFNIHDLQIESVQIRASINHQDMSHIGIELISPHGTRSILKSVQDQTTFANMDDFVFLTNAFYGERAKGMWQLRIVDGKPGIQGGTLRHWYIRFTGTKKVSEEDTL